MFCPPNGLSIQRALDKDVPFPTGPSGSEGVMGRHLACDSGTDATSTSDIESSNSVFTPE